MSDFPFKMTDFSVNFRSLVDRDTSLEDLNIVFANLMGGKKQH